MKSKKLGAAVIALKEGLRHIKAYQSCSDTELLAICDTDSELLESRRAEFNVSTAVVDYRAILAMPEIQVVSVASPDYFHAEHAIAALQAGKHVLCEKPMTLNLADAEAIIRAVRETGRIFMTGHPTRFTPAFMLAYKMVRRGDIGELFMVESEYAHNYSHARGKDDWRVDPRRDPFIGGACHAVDLIRWIVGVDPVEAFAYGNHKCLTDWPVNDAYMSVFKFANGVIGKVMCSIGLVRPYTMRSVFYGTEGTIVCDNMSATMQVASTWNSNHEKHADFATIPVEVDNHNVEGEVAALVAAIRTGQPPQADVCEGAKTVAACVAAVESARSGKPVSIDSSFMQ
jgi:1,5-anhydro-D-fructose reductase (1,5-anhydro-D-mannitol-forming)